MTSKLHAGVYYCRKNTDFYKYLQGILKDFVKKINNVKDFKKKLNWNMKENFLCKEQI